MSDKSEKARKLDVRSAVVKEFKDLPTKHFRQATLAILSLLQNATPHDSAALLEHQPWRRLDIGEYRVIYQFAADTVYVALLGKRNDAEVYKRLRRF